MPGRFGSLSANTSGSTFQSQYGTPTVPSVPIEPYLNSVTMSVARLADDDTQCVDDRCGDENQPRRK